MERISCDTCKTTFNLTKSTLKTKKVTPTKTHKDVQVAFIECPECGTKVVAYYTNRAIRALQSRQRKLQGDTLLRKELGHVNVMTQFTENAGNIKKQMRQLRAELEN